MSEAPNYQLPPANPDTVAHFKRQWVQSIEPGMPHITCECGATINMRFLFRCLYCGCWFCQRCAEVHFGKTRKQYAAEAVAKAAANA